VLPTPATPLPDSVQVADQTADRGPQEGSLSMPDGGVPEYAADTGDDLASAVLLNRAIGVLVTGNIKYVSFGAELLRLSGLTAGGRVGFELEAVSDAPCYGP
jgi:hypothetical protein